MELLLFQPRLRRRKLLGGWSKRQAVVEIHTAIAQREELGGKQIAASAGAQPQGTSGKSVDEAIAPFDWQDTRQACWFVVEPIVG